MAVQHKIAKEQLAELYRQMRLIRTFEEECSRQYMLGKIRGFLHLYIGQEATGVGAISSLRPQDYVVTHYRDHGQALARGMEPKVVMAELFGKATGSSKGKGGSMHLFSKELNFMGGYAIVGGQLPIATGLALAAKLRKEDRVALCFLGDGAMNEGEFHEAMNLASVWRLPIIFFCENNLYGMGAPVWETFAAYEELYKFAEAYKMHGVRVDGMDLFAVRDVTQRAIDQVLTGEGPVFVEAQTYRFRGHSIADPAEYRRRHEVDTWLSRDPLPRVRQMLLDSGASEDQVQEMEQAVDAQVAEAVKFADESPWPEPSALYEDVYTAGGRDGA